MDLLFELLRKPLAFIVLALPLLYSVILHELAHGLVASWFGDNTARYAGRLSLNPLRHLDPVGTLMVFLVGFGWAKPVPVKYQLLRGKKFGLAAVALAGCITNILFAIVAIFFLQFEFVRGNFLLLSVTAILAKVNVMLAALNLIPIPPLDGSKVIMAFLPEKTQYSLASLEPYGFFIIIVLVITGLLCPLIDFMTSIIYGFISLLLGWL